MTNSRTLPSFAVVVPAYNEENGIVDCVTAIAAVLSTLENRTALIVVDDGSSDATVARIEQDVSESSHFVVVRHEVNRGYGAALRSGTTQAREHGFDYVVFMDSDLTNDPSYLPLFAEAMNRRPDVIKATRRSGGGGYRGVPIRRIIPATVGNLVARILFGLPLHDSTNGYRAVRTSLLDAIDLVEDGFAIIMEEIYRLRPFAQSYAEVPVVLTARKDDLRPSAFEYSAETLWRYLRYPLLAAVDRARSAVGR
jgi:dolichol-phosphate mannosyltransferase